MRVSVIASGKTRPERHLVGRFGGPASRRRGALQCHRHQRHQRHHRQRRQLITAGSLTVASGQSDDNAAEADAGSGGAVAGDAAAPDTTTTANTTAAIGSGAIINSSGAVAVSAQHTAAASTKVTAVAVGLLSGAGAEAVNTINSNVTAAVDSSAQVTAQSINVGATNALVTSVAGSSNIDGDTGGIASAASATSTMNVSFNTIVDIQNSAHLTISSPNPGDLYLHAFNGLGDANWRDDVSFKTGGALSGASTHSYFNLNADVAKVNIGSGAQLTSPAAMHFAVDASAQLFLQVNTDTYGAVTVADLPTAVPTSVRTTRSWWAPTPQSPPAATIVFTAGEDPPTSTTTPTRSSRMWIRLPARRFPSPPSTRSPW